MSTCSASPIRIERIAGLQSHHLGRSSPEKPPPDEKQDPGSSMLLSSCRSDLQALRASSASSADAGIPSDSIIRRGQKQSGNADEAAPLAASATAELRDQCCNKPRSHQAVDVTVMASAETHHGSTTVNNAATETQTKEVNHVISQKASHAPLLLLTSPPPCSSPAVCRLRSLRLNSITCSDSHQCRTLKPHLNGHVISRGPKTAHLPQRSNRPRRLPSHLPRAPRAPQAPGLRPLPPPPLALKRAMTMREPRLPTTAAATTGRHHHHPPQAARQRRQPTAMRLTTLRPMRPR